jgi:hypothetical protein
MKPPHHIGSPVNMATPHESENISSARGIHDQHDGSGKRLVNPGAFGRSIRHYDTPVGRSWHYTVVVNLNTVSHVPPSPAS